MTDLYLRAPDQATLDAALLAAGMIDADGNPSPGISLDRIGQDPTRIKSDGTTETLPGYHANVRAMIELTDDQLAVLAPITIALPAQPMRIWA